MYYIYQRVSTQSQTLIRQQGIISEYCKSNNIIVDSNNIYSDTITGKTIKRENYQKMKAKLQKGDILIIQSLDRLGRNWDLIKNEWHDFMEKGIYIIIIDCPLINVLPDANGNVSVDKRLIQEMMFTLLCYVSQKEVEKISSRTKDAIRAKKSLDPNFKIGRPSTIDGTIKKRIMDLRQQNYSIRQIASLVSVSPSSVATIIKGE